MYILFLNANIVFSGSAKSGWRFNGKFENQTLENVLESMSNIENFNYKIDVKEDPQLPHVTISEKVEDLEIKGAVLDEMGNPLPGVTVIVEGTNIGAVTDLEGNFEIAVEEGDVLVFSFIGYKDERVTVSTQSVIDVTMFEDEKSLDEVVVIGYGTQKKSDVTGAVTNVSEEKLQSRPVVNLSDALVGRSSGVQIQQLI